MLRIKLIAAGVIFISTTAYGQQPQEYILKLTPAEIDIVGKGLGLLPFNEVAPLIQKLRNQVVEQQTPNKPMPSIQQIPDPPKP